MYSADDLIGATQMNPSEVETVQRRLILSSSEHTTGQSVQQFADSYGLMPMLVARTLSEARPEDNSLRSLIATNEFLIKTFGKKRISREAVEGDLLKMDKFWRSNDPLGVYRPGDLFYVDDDHPWRDFFPLLILVPTAIALLLFGLAALINVVIK